LYPLFVPPKELQYPGKKPKQLRRDQAEASFNWFLSVQAERVSHLLNFLGLSLQDDYGELLERTGKEVFARLRQNPFSHTETGQRVATPVGLSLAADMGMLVGQLLINASNGRIRWTLLTEPEDGLHYQLPVLMGTHPYWHVEPIRASIMKTKQMIRGDEMVQTIRGKIPEYLMNEIKGPRQVFRKAPTASVRREMYDSALGNLLAS